MTIGSSGFPSLRILAPTPHVQTKTPQHRPPRHNVACKRLGLLAATLFLTQLAFAQARPHVTAVDPQAGKASDNMTLMGENLGKDSVSAVYLSDDTTDHEAMVVEQAADKIVAKVPKVKAGSYNVSIKVGEQIFILPLRFTVQE
jgi:hypothetical protein